MFSSTELQFYLGLRQHAGMPPSHHGSAQTANLYKLLMLLVEDRPTSARMFQRTATIHSPLIVRSSRDFKLNVMALLAVMVL